MQSTYLYVLSICSVSSETEGSAKLAQKYGVILRSTSETFLATVKTA